MKVVILAGGFGSRISEESHLKPKPMIEIGNRPILWHIMKSYAHFGFNDFIICAGYRQHVIKEYFSDFFLQSSDVSFDFRSGEPVVEILDTKVEPWHVTVADTGYSTMTAGRINRIHKYVGDEPFMLTYGDGLADVNPNDVLAFHREAGGIVTITGVAMAQRFGVLDIADDGRIWSFREKRTDDDALVNGGFMVCEPGVFDFMGTSGKDPDREDFSGDTLEALARAGELTCYQHDGFWMCMDTARDREQLQQLWRSGAAPWKVWE